MCDIIVAAGKAIENRDREEGLAAFREKRTPTFRGE